MSRSVKLSILAAAFAAPLALASGARAQIASFCDGALVANAFYNSVQSSDGRVSTVAFNMVLQNRTDRPVPRIAVTFAHPEASDRLADAWPFPHPGLLPYEQVIVMLGTQILRNPSGEGALSPYDLNRGVPHAVSVACPAP